MSEISDASLAKVHFDANDKKFFCFFTGFLEGVLASQKLEEGEVEPLLAMCKEFIDRWSDGDAGDFLLDFEAEIFELDSVKVAVEIRLDDIDLSCDRSAMNRFLGLAAGVGCDGKIFDSEAQVLVEFSMDHPSILDDPYCRALIDDCKDALEDGVVDADEAEAICDSITRLVGDAYADTGIAALGNVPVFDSISIKNEVDPFGGKSFVLTGEFSINPRQLIVDRIVERGGLVAKSVSKKTDYVVVADGASRDWVLTHKGTKIIKAQELRECFERPDFLREGEILRLLELK